MSEAPHPLELPASIKSAAEQLARAEGVSLDEWIASAVAQKIGAVETAEFFRRRAGDAKLEDLHALLALAPDRAPDPSDELPEP